MQKKKVTVQRCLPIIAGFFRADRQSRDREGREGANQAPPAPSRSRL